MRRYYRRRRSKSSKTNKTAMALLLICCFGFAAIRAIVEVLLNIIPLISVLFVFAILALGGYAIYRYIGKKCETFVLEHSVAIKKISEINARYHFEHVPNLDMHHFYDNQHFYLDISPLDYLTYQLVSKKDEVLRAIDSAEKNKTIFSDYLKNVEAIQEFGKYDTEAPLFFEKIRIAKEKKIFNGKKITPVTDLVIQVVITLTNIHGRYRDEKIDFFDSKEIKQIIRKILQKDGDFYKDEDVWQSICRVERGKVTNKIRFAIYERDGNRCRRCGSTHDLEIDHIYPISKGGKSNFANLQTLCHACNSLKSNKIEYGTRNSTAGYQKGGSTCANCGGKLVLRKGKNGEFYGCSNYPKCRYTKAK